MSECFSHPANEDPACAYCAAYRVGLRGSEALSAAEAATMLSLRDQWVRTTRPATPGRTDWVELWTRDGELFRAWWGRDADGTAIREIEGVAGFPPGVHADPRCDAVELARLWFPDPADAAAQLNGLSGNRQADLVFDLLRRFDGAEPQRLRRLACQAGVLGLDRLDWRSDLDDLKDTVHWWATWRAVKALPEAASLSYPALIERLRPLQPAEARHWVEVVGVDAAVEWWLVGATPAEAERAIGEVAEDFCLDDVTLSIIDDLEDLDANLAAFAGPRLQDGALQRAARAHAWHRVGIVGRWCWRFRALARRRAAGLAERDDL